MKLLLLLLFIIPFFSFAQSKSLKTENDRLQSENIKLKAENDSLKIALKKCSISNQMFLLTLNQDGPTFKKEQTLTSEQKEELLLAKLNSAPDSIQKKAMEIKMKVDSFVQYCQEFKEKLVEATGGYDENKMPVGKRNIEDVENLLIKEGKATELKNNLIKLRNELIELAPKELVVSEINTMDVSKFTQTGKTWEEYTFGRMPLVAIYPMINKFRNDAINDKIFIIELLVEQK